jgi:hypothetical protein
MKRIIIQSEAPPEFGELKESPEFKQGIDYGRDLTFVPGFSDLRRKRDEAIAEVRNNQRDPKTVPTLPVNLRWVRNQRKDGTPDSRKIITSGNLGYRTVTKEDIGQEWLTKLPGGAAVAADGTIRMGDTILMIATAEQAAKNAFNKRAKTAQQMEGALKGFETAASAFRKKGSDPFAVIEKSTKVTGTVVPSDNKVNPKDAS